MLTDKRIEEIFSQMDGFVLELSDPSMVGPVYFIDKIAVCRNYLNAVSLVLSELSREKLVVGGELRKQESLYQMESARLLVTDNNVRMLSNIKDRESMVAHILHNTRERIEELKSHMVAVDAVTKTVSHRSRELHATMDAIKNQRRYLQIEVQTGSFYGDERAIPNTPVQPTMGVSDPSFNEAELASFFDDVKVSTTTESTVSPKVESAQDADDKAIADFLSDTQPVETTNISDESKEISTLLDLV